jgi:hypothetical protein
MRRHSIGFQMANTSKLDRKTIDAVCDGIRIGMTFEAACKLGGISRRTLELWRAAAPNSPESETLQYLDSEIEGAIADGQRVLLRRMHDHSTGVTTNQDGEAVRCIGDFNATKWLLEARHKMRPETKLDITSGGQPLQYLVTIPVVERIDAPIGGAVNEDGE